MSTAHPQKRKRALLSVADKLQVCDEVRKGLSYARVSDKFSIGKSTVRDIVKSEEKLRCFQSQLQDEDWSKRRCIVRLADFPDVDKAVCLWFVQERSAGTPVSGPALMAKAQQLYKKLHPEDSDSEKFKAGTGWLKRFRDRHGVHSPKTQGESLSADTSAIPPFKERLEKLVADAGLTCDQVFNCDKTGLNWRQLPSRTLVTGREKEAKGFKKSKDRVTLMACANASGSISMPLMFIHKSANPRCFKNIRKEDLPVHYCSQKNSWMDSSLFKAWFFDKFVPHCRSALRDLNLPEKALLLLDNAPSHPGSDTLVTEDGNIRCVFLPPNTTSMIQPMD